MPTITIDETGCRACDLCVETCPTEVLAMDAAGDKAQVINQDDCIGCASCTYICPSRCISISEYQPQRPMYRIEQNTALIARFLQRKPAEAELTAADFDEGLNDVSVRLHGLSQAITETLGRGQKAAGRKAGQLAAERQPELYRAATLESALAALMKSFNHGFDLDCLTDGDDLDLDFKACALKRVVEAQGETVGEAALCKLFHEYLAGLFGTFTGHRFKVDPGDAPCRFKLLSQ